VPDPASPTPIRQAILDEPLRPRLSETLAVPCAAFDPGAVHHIGVFLGEGVGAEVVPVAMRMLDLLAAHSPRQFQLHQGGLIGLPAKAECGSSLSDDVTLRRAIVRFGWRNVLRPRWRPLRLRASRALQPLLQVHPARTFGRGSRRRRDPP